MPNFDHKGPGGFGQKTGKKLGKCVKTKAEKKGIEKNYLFRKAVKLNTENTSHIKHFQNLHTGE